MYLLFSRVIDNSIKNFKAFFRWLYVGKYLYCSCTLTNGSKTFCRSHLFSEIFTRTNIHPYIHPLSIRLYRFLVPVLTLLEIPWWNCTGLCPTTKQHGVPVSHPYDQSQGHCSWKGHSLGQLIERGGGGEAYWFEGAWAKLRWGVWGQSYWVLSKSW